MKVLLDSLYVALGAAVGANARHWVSVWFVGKTHSNFPWQTLAVNVSGSLVLGAFLALALTQGWSHHWRLAVAVGLCGGYTTYSSFSAEMVRLMEERHWNAALSYFLASNVLSIAACLAGAHFARVLWSRA